MSIVNSTYMLGSLDPSGRRSYVELHTDNTGFVHRAEYFVPDGTDCAALLSASAVLLDARLKAKDLYDAIFRGAWDYTLNHANANDLAAYVREVYKNGSRERLAQTAKRVMEWITNGRFTDLQVRTAFGLTSGQWTTLKTKMQALVVNYEAVNAAVGE